MSKLRKIGLPYGLIFILATVLYSNTSNHDYAWDDAIVLVENDRVQKGLSDIPELFENIKSTETEHRYGYRPIALLSFATDVQLFGMDPKASHRVNILLYGILCLLVLYFLERFFPGNLWRNFLIASLFAVHPLHTEVVANIKSRDEILALIFGLMGLITYLKGFKEKQWFQYVLSAFLFVLAFHSKESAITFCGVTFLIPWFFGQEHSVRTKFFASLPSVGIVILLLSIRLYVYSDVFFQSTDVELTAKGLFHQDGFVGNPLVDYDLTDKLGMAFYLLVFYLYKFFWPHPLVHDYSFNQLQVLTWSNWEVWASLLVCVGLILAGFYGMYKGKSYGFGILFFLVSSSVYLHLAQPAPDIFGERFLFVPSLGICIALISLYQLKIKNKWLNIGLVLLLIPQFGYTFHRNKAWKDNETLLLTDLKNQPNCVRANYNYGLMLHADYYEASPQEQHVLKAKILKAYEHTVNLTDRLLNAELDLAAAYMEFGYPEKAYPIFIGLTERHPELSTPYTQVGKYHMSFKEYDEAIYYFEKALEIGSANSDYHYLLSICQFNTGLREQAIETLLEGEKLGVSSPAYFSLEARLYMKFNRVEDALAAVERGLKLFPTDQELNGRLAQLRQLQINGS